MKKHRVVLIILLAIIVLMNFSTASHAAAPTTATEEVAPADSVEKNDLPPIVVQICGLIGAGGLGIGTMYFIEEGKKHKS